jgi:flavin-dependent dehydrogenase
MDSESSHPSWDAIVVGAGPAGSVTARELARSGCRVLLVDKANFPRTKVCGCCLNGMAVEMLKRLGLGHLLAEAAPLNRIVLSASHRTAHVNLPGGVALSREVFDARLVEEAVKAGVAFRPGILARIGAGLPHERGVDLNGETEFARVIIVATGLANGDALPEAGSRIGAAIMLPVESEYGFFVPGTIYMATGRHGYVGLVRVEDDRLDVAAAFDAGFIKFRGGLGQAAESILKGVGWPVPAGLLDAPWKGTPALTRRAVHISAYRLFAVGDAAGYIEPFTGEGMAWAILSASLLTPLAVRATNSWDDEFAIEWKNIHDRVLGPRQRRCRMVAKLLRFSLFRNVAIGALSLFPNLGRPVVASFNHFRHLPQPTSA